MKIRPLAVIATFALLSGAALQIARSAPTDKTNPATPTAAKPMSVYDFKLKSLDGKDVDMAKYKGKTLLIVNTASKCGFTRQYANLEALYKEKKAEGLIVLGFPANNFASQEPGTDEEIGAFCQKNFGVSFPMFSKSSVKGKDISPLYRYLIENAVPSGDVAWNFEKFLIGRDGKIVGRYKTSEVPITKDVLAEFPSTRPAEFSTRLTADINTELAKKVP